jgi:SAM-dependent methyltransferase
MNDKNEWDDSKYIENGQITYVDHKRWIEAQEFEEKCWQDAWTLQDDWNNWWKNQFDGYEILEENLPDDIRAIEVGCGPFTNMRLIESVLQYKNELRLYLSDPLILSYLKLPTCWVKENSYAYSKNHSENRIITLDDSRLEKLKFDNDAFDLLVCINVLDHVENVDKCFKEIYRVLKSGGLFILGQDLTDWEKRKDPSPKEDQDQGHPIRINEEYCNEQLQSYEPLLSKIVESRAPQAHYGCLCFIGKK